MLVCVVEGHGDVKAAPKLTDRVLRELLGTGDRWHVHEDPVRQPRSSLVKREGLERALKMAAARDPAGILVLCDADDDCAAEWGAQFPKVARYLGRSVEVRGVMASREYESWLLSARPREVRKHLGALTPDIAPRNAKKALEKLVRDYTPATGQLYQTREMDLHRAWAVSDSFDKLVRSVAQLVGAKVPARPAPS